MNRAEYNRAVDHFSDDVFRFIFKACRSREMAEDIVQDSYMKLWEMLSVIAYEKAKAFLFKTAYHRMIDLLRREKKFGDVESLEHHAPVHTQAYSGLQEILEHALERLPQAQKNVVLLRDYEDYSYREIAEITGLTEAQVRVYIFRARVFMKSFLRSPDLVI